MIVRVFQMGVLWSVLLLAGCASHQAGTCAATHGRAGGGSRAPIVYNRGGGTIRFGTHLDKNYNLHGHKSVYAVHDSVAWEAEFPRELKSTMIYLVIFRQECGSGSPVYRGAINIPETGAGGYSEEMYPSGRFSYNLGSSGRYVMRYVHGSTILAEGRFTLKDR